LADESDFYDPFYKGCTSPSTAFGIPLLPFVLGTLVFGEIGILVFFTSGIALLLVVVFLYFAVFGWAKRVSRNDEQRLLQLMLRLRMRLRQRKSRTLWGAISFGPGPQWTKKRRRFL
jgi:type IV secretion system protein VirB3